MPEDKADKWRSDIRTVGGSHVFRSDRYTAILWSHPFRRREGGALLRACPVWPSAGPDGSIRLANPTERTPALPPTPPTILICVDGTQPGMRSGAWKDRR